MLFFAWPGCAYFWPPLEIGAACGGIRLITVLATYVTNTSLLMGGVGGACDCALVSARDG